MDPQIIEWIDFCEGRRNFGHSHFYTLFFEGEAENGRRSEQELRWIFEQLPKGNELFDRAAKFLMDALDDALPADMDRYLIENTRKDLRQKTPIILEANETQLAQRMEGPIRIVNDRNTVFESRQHSDWDALIYGIIGDYETDQLAYDTPSVYELSEAFYGFFTNMDMVHYLLSPLTNSSINFEFYFNLWCVGADYSVTEEGIIVAR